MSSKKPQQTEKQPFYIKQLKGGQWAVFDQQQRIHGGTHATKAEAETVLAAKLAERKGN